jgi:para-aminobenzoate synthetase component 1
MDTHNYTHTSSSYECLCAVDAVETFYEIPVENADWLFGHINFEWGYSINNIQHHTKTKTFQPFQFFKPRVVLFIIGNELYIESFEKNAEAIYDEILSAEIVSQRTTAVAIEPLLLKAEYISIIEKLRAHILRGDCYEINFCQPFVGNGKIEPVNVYQKLLQLSPTPFSCYYKVNDGHLLCASPERFFRKENNKIISQPIKGTIGRAADHVTDEKFKQELSDSEKDRSENVMVVDLVRNDLSRICTEGTVTTSELFRIYSFPQVHQMISTVEGELKDEITMKQIFNALFPMGSMTGAPKHSVLELTKQYEIAERGIYSGTVGYIDPNGNADFNVVIRSIVYDNSTNDIRYHVGGGITFYSDPEKEYEECLLKATAMKKVLAEND